MIVIVKAKETEILNIAYVLMIGGMENTEIVQICLQVARQMMDFVVLLIPLALQKVQNNKMSIDN